MKIAFHLIVLALALFAWMSFMNTGSEIEGMKSDLEVVWESGDPDGKAIKMEKDIEEVEGERLLYGVMLTFATAGVFGILIVSYLLPMLAQRMTHAVYDSGEEVEQDAMREAHSLLAQGEYEDAIEAFKKAAAEDPLNRLPWVEIAKIQREHFQDSTAAVQTLTGALEGQEWVVDDAAYLMFRIAELYDEDLGNRETARQIMQQCIDSFPETRHSANAAQKMRVWESEGGDAALRAEEEAFLARQRAAEAQQNDPNS